MLHWIEETTLLIFLIRRGYNKKALSVGKITKKAMLIIDDGTGVIFVRLAAAF